MKQFSPHFITIIFIMSLFFPQSCITAKNTSDNKAIMEREFEGAPEWVTKGCYAYLKQHNDERISCGVGSSPPSKNPSDARTVAVVVARAEIARSIQTHITNVLKDYSLTTTGKRELGQDYQRIENFSLQVSQMILPGTEVIEFWISKNGTQYALVAITKEQFKDSINQMKAVPDSLKDNIIERAEKSFNEIDNIK